MKIRIWAIEDSELELAKIKLVVAQLNERTGLEVDFESSQHFDCILPEAKWPSIVILDLFDNGLYGEELFSGDAVYSKIRQFEENRRKTSTKTGKSCFIILWTGFTASPQVEQCLQEWFRQDNRLIKCAVKSAAHLKMSLSGCIERIQHEDR